jgi:hypothetical protein
MMIDRAKGEHMWIFRVIVKLRIPRWFVLQKFTPTTVEYHVYIYQKVFLI